MSLEPSTKKFPFSLLRNLLKKGVKKINQKNSRRKKVIIYGILALLILTTVLVSSLMPLKGTLIVLEPKEFVKGFTEEGQVLAAQEWPLYNSVDGKISVLHVQNGDAVTKGQILLELDTKDLVYQLDSLKAQLKSVEGQHLQSSNNPQEALLRQQNLLIGQAEKDYRTLEKNLERAKALYEAGAIPLTQYEEAQLKTESAKNYWEQQKAALDLIYEQHEPLQGTEQFYKGQEEALKAQIRQLENKISQAKVTAPEDGIIKDCLLKEGEFALTGQELLKVFAHKGYKVESYVLASDAPSIKPGDPVEIIQDTSNGEETLSGEVERVDPAAVERLSPLGLKENRVRVTIRLHTDSPVVIGSTVDVRFITHKESGQILVPKTALFPYEEGDAIWVIREGKARIQPVVKGMENDREVVILEGLTEGDQVLLDTDLAGLKEGKAVKSI